MVSTSPDASGHYSTGSEQDRATAAHVVKWRLTDNEMYDCWDSKHCRLQLSN